MPSTQWGTVTGYVTDLAGDAGAGAQIWLLNRTIGFCRAQLTDKAGAVTFDRVPPETDYLVEVEKPGFAPQFRRLSVQVNDMKLLLPVVVLQPISSNARTDASDPERGGKSSSKGGVAHYCKTDAGVLGPYPNDGSVKVGDPCFGTDKNGQRHDGVAVMSQRGNDE
jgi:hypothetical protein